MTITVDCRWIDASGVGVYLRECLPFFLDSGHSFYLLGNSQKIASHAEGKKNVCILDCSLKPFSLTELFAFPHKLLKKINSGDLFYSPYFNIPGSLTIPIFTTIHDMVFPDIPHLSSSLGLKARMWFYRRAFKHSKKIFTVSEFSASRIKYYSQNKVSVVVTHSALKPHLFNYSGNEPKKNTILFIGNIKKHKGLSVLVEAFLEAQKEGLQHKLIIIGTRDNFRSKDAALSFSDHEDIEFSGFLTEEKLVEYLSSASLLVQPSLYEGFCLPPLEALAAGTPSLISDIPVLREIYSEYPLKTTGQEFPVFWFKAGDSKDLKEKLLLVLTRKTQDPVELPLPLKNLYTFKKTSAAILNSLSK